MGYQYELKEIWKYQDELVKYTSTFALLVFVSVTTACSSIAIRTAIEIDAPTEGVYAVLSDLDSYPN